MIDLISEQLRNEFPESKKNMPEVAVRIYNLVMMEQPDHKIIEAKEVLKSVLNILKIA